MEPYRSPLRRSTRWATYTAPPNSAAIPQSADVILMAAGWSSSIRPHRAVVGLRRSFTPLLRFQTAPYPHALRSLIRQATSTAQPAVLAPSARAPCLKSLRRYFSGRAIIALLGQRFTRPGQLA